METITLAINATGTFTSIAIVLGVLSLIYFVIYYRIRQQVSSNNKARVWAGISTIIGTPLLTIMIVGTTMAYYYYEDVLSSKPMSYSLYDVTDDMIREMNLVGKTKKEVVNLLGVTDTTHSELIYDFSREEDPGDQSVKQKLGKYILVVSCQGDRVVSYHRKK
ncbi:hypothetical protein [Xanthocytophaga agilis]|uniref:Uncharacterized protein n=1 Tax=Xanthocytophaga agilis TaxID=3048010 RepID=A0AAE3RB72_9BACT|nr:hypothetical protein [Xanthocytophaga agilis]MDJ1506660.1 hypothetical protein [Xanthocytophaga agilis]